MLHHLSVFILPALLTVAALTDVMAYRIPNWLTLLTAAMFFPMALATGMPWAEFSSHLVAGVSLFVIGFLMFQFGVFGGGDAKLMAAAGLWFGTAKMVPFIVMTALAGGLLALLIGIWAAVMMHFELKAQAAPMVKLSEKLRKLTPNVPYGLAFACGGIVAFKDTWWITGLS
jgi:prepilin peptidase CpaA